MDSDNKVNSWMVKKKFPKLNFLIVFLAWARKIQKRVQKKKNKKKTKEEEICEILFELEKDLSKFQITVENKTKRYNSTRSC